MKNGICNEVTRWIVGGLGSTGWGPLLLVLLAGNRADAAQVDPLSRWTLRNPPLPPTTYGGGATHLRNLAFGSGRFVIYDTQGILFESVDGLSWASPNGWGAPTGLAWANNRFLMGWNYGNITYSPDGLGWTNISWPANAAVTDAAYGNGIYVATTELDYANCNLTTSPTAAAWTTRNTGWANGAESVAFGNSVFAVVGKGGKISRSSNGTTWAPQTSPVVANLWSVRFGNGVFVAVGDSGTMLSSSDAVTWVVRSSGTIQTLNRVGFCNNEFITVGASGTMLASTDGVSWTARASGTTLGLYGVGYGNGRYVAVGDSAKLLVSTNGVNWTSPITLTTAMLTSTVYGTSNFVAVGYGGAILTSPSGSSWTLQNAGTTANLYSVAFGKGLFVAAGQAFLSSSNGTAWTVRRLNVSPAIETVAFVNNAFYAVGDSGTMWVSTNGTDWATRSSGTTTTLYGIAYGNGMYVVCGAGGLIRTSIDGLTWTSRSSGTTYDLNGLTFARGQFLAQGNGGVILTSPNGMTWTPRTSGTTEGLATSTYAAGNYVAVGMSGLILSSKDGITWVSHWTRVFKLLVGVGFGASGTEGSFVVVGDGGTILQSDPLPAPPFIVSPPQSLAMECGSNATFTVEATGAAPLRYQWRKNGAAVPGAIATSITVTPVACQVPDFYSVVVTNVSGSVTSAVAILSVVDTIAPSLSVPADIVVSTDPGQPTAVVSFSAIAADGCGVPVVTFNPASGTGFPVGTNVVGCVARDCGGNSNAQSFLVIVLDTEAPRITTPTNLVAPCKGTNGACVEFVVTATDNVDTNVLLRTEPASGSVFPCGTTLVHCTAVDTCNNSNYSSFTVTVSDIEPPRVSIAPQAGLLQIEWPPTCANYHLQESVSLDPVEWQNSAVIPEFIDGKNRAVVPITNASRFYRLERY